MPRKIILILTLILFASLLTGLNSPPANAKELEIDGQTYWTYDEAINKEGLLDDRYFMITGLNPKNSTIRVVFQDEAAARWRPWTDEKDVFKELHFFWWEKGWPELGGDFFETENPKFHAILDRVAEPGENWLPANQEVEIPVPEETFEILRSNSLYYFVKSEMMTALSEQHVETCIADIAGRENYKCSVLFGENGDTLYYPTEVELPENVLGDIITESSSLEDSPLENLPLEQSPMKEPIVSEIAPEKAMTLVTTSTTEKISTSTMGVPETLKEPEMEVPFASKIEHEQRGFPWWIIIFVLSGIFIVLWWLIPAKKLQKKS